MIATLTLNPSLDYHLSPDGRVREGEVNLVPPGRLCPGGKGINVSLVLHALDVETRAYYVSAGVTGALLDTLLGETGVPSARFALPEGATRLNIKIHARTDTELNDREGAPISPENLTELVGWLSALGEGDTLVLAGSTANLPDTVYADIMRALDGKGIRFAVDARGERLRKTLPLHPFLIKPNHHELGELFGVCLNTPAEAERYARKLQENGAQYVLVSMGDRGCVLLTPEGEVLSHRALRGAKVKGTTGAGDSMLAGFLAGLERYGDEKKALHLGLAAASASVFSGHLARREDTEQIFAFLNA